MLADADQEYDRLTNPAVQAPPPPVHAARLSGLLKSLASAEGAVAESIKARRALIGSLDKMLEKNREMLQVEEGEESEIASRKTLIETKKREVEDGIMRGLAEESNPPRLSRMAPTGHLLTRTSTFTVATEMWNQKRRPSKP